MAILDVQVTKRHAKCRLCGDVILPDEPRVIISVTDRVKRYHESCFVQNSLEALVKLRYTTSTYEKVFWNWKKGEATVK